ncbi:MAG: PQQ-binding-like beta-propeller repeat protein [Chitinophagales bacterium]|nr:PQQ-binding-like beta-propeller repeat protein [Chitinophagales bacterium]
MTNKFLLLFPLLLTLASCDRCKNNDPEKFGDMTIRWKTEFPANDYYGSITPEISGDHVVYSNYAGFGEEVFIAANADNGKEQWRWNDYINDNSRRTSGNDNRVSINGTLAITPANGLIGLNMKTGKTTFKQNFYPFGFTSPIGQEEVIRGTKPNDQTIAFKIINMRTGAMRQVCTIDTLSTPYCAYTKPSYSVETSGDTVLYFSLTESFQQPDLSQTSYVEFLAFNITKNKLLWKIPGLNARSIVYNDKLYVFSDHLSCLNKTDGSLIWENKVNTFNGAYFAASNNKLIVAGEQIKVFDAAFGAELWSVSNTGYIHEPLIHNNIMYFISSTDGRLWALRMSTGDRIWHIQSPDSVEDPAAFWASNVGVDPVRNRLFIASYKKLYCIDPAQ